ncbi:MAG: hypothetical protein K2Q23_13020, partial [Bryobacteraceae bacterium]|nr:hypothetical protein [Bryobacteraceae bacterium]
MRRRTLFGLPFASLWAQTNRVTTRTGFAETDITPEIGMEQPGGYGKVYHRTLHDPCKARAVVFDDGRRRVAVVGIDALITPRSVTLQARQEIERRTGIPAAAVMIAASHSHSSGPVGMVMPGEYDHASAFVQELAYQKSSGADSKYLDLLTRRIIEAVEK